MTKEGLSGLVIAFNEELRIVDCIRSLFEVCDDVVVVDSCSTDRTVELAECAGATVLKQSFLGDGPQRNFGIPHCRHDWIINLDADEVLEADFVDFMKRNELDSLAVDAIASRRRNYVGGRTTRLAGQYPDYVVRVFDRRKARFSNVKVHTRIQAARILRTAVHIKHHSYADYADLFARAVKYGAWAADDLAARGVPINRFSGVLHGATSLLKHYVVKMGFLAGADGLNISLAKALSSYLKYAHARERLVRTKVLSDGQSDL
ncbi:MAG: glycosyltransferase family 2 protein [Moraxellaceae bacterium]|nr:glycosyltransferase family 2 protein [Moraxellaceae bacterium]